MKYAAHTMRYDLKDKSHALNLHFVSIFTIHVDAFFVRSISFCFALVCLTAVTAVSQLAMIWLAWVCVAHF